MKKNTYKILAAVALFLVMMVTLSIHTYAASELIQDGKTISESQVVKASLAAPTNVKVTPYNYNRVRLTYNKVSGASGYVVYISTSKNGTYSYYGYISGSSSTDILVRYLNVRTTYYFKVAAYKTVYTNRGTFSSVVSGKVKETVASVSALTQVGNTGIKVNWSRVAGAARYEIYCSQVGASLKKVATVSSSSSRVYTIKGLTNAKTYKVAVRAVYYNNYTGKYVQGTVSSVVQKYLKPPVTPTYRALLIGEVKYSSKLYGPDNDTAAMKRLLKQMKKPYSVTVKNNATKSQILSAITSAFSGAKSTDVSLFYYSGHGVTSSGSYSGALLAIDGYTITMTELAAALNKVPGKVIVILDSCGSGAAVSKDASALTLDETVFTQSAVSAFASVDSVAKYGELATNKFAVLAAAKAHEYSYSVGAAYASSAYGLLTKAITTAAGMNYWTGSYSGSMPGDYNHNGRLTQDELRRYTTSYASGRQTTVAYPYASEGNYYNILCRS